MHLSGRRSAWLPFPTRGEGGRGRTRLASDAIVPPAADSNTRPIAVIVDREGLGDSLLKLPMLRAVARAFPRHPIWWIATHQTAMAQELAPFVAPLLPRVIDHAGITEPAREVIPRLKQLPPFELVFDTRTRVATVLLARMFLRHRGFYACLPGFVLSDARPPRRWTRPRNVALRGLSMVEAAVQGPVDCSGTLDVSAAAQAVAAQRLPPGPTYVGLAPGSREARKNWPLDRFAALARALALRNVTPVFLVGPQERAWLEELRRAAPMALFPEAEPVDPALGIRRLELAIAIGHRLAAAVANDSGVGHLMAAIGTPIVSLFGPSDPQRWQPFADLGVVVRAQDFGGAAMAAIPVEAAFAAVNALLTRAETLRARAAR